ncbi:MAG: amidohydrolase [bacterium]|nr:amidohydrolase [bacterium]
MTNIFCIWGICTGQNCLILEHRKQYDICRIFEILTHTRCYQLLSIVEHVLDANAFAPTIDKTPHHPQVQTMKPEQLIQEITNLRHQLHTHAEISGREHTTAQLIKKFLFQCEPTAIHENLGGTGLVAIFESPNKTPGPSIMLRAELDGLPLPEAPGCTWPSQNLGSAHKCGHDGHMAILCGVARRLQETPPEYGQVILLFQPAEETGSGASTLLQDPHFTALKPDLIFALHNLPGYPAGDVLTRQGPFAAGSVGLKIGLHGATSHAAYPEQGQSPDLAMAEMVTTLVNMNRTDGSDLALVTVVHARLGEARFGISPGDAEIMATVRAEKEEVLQNLKAIISEKTQLLATQFGFKYQIEYCEEFPVTMNTPQAVNIINQAAQELGLDQRSPNESPFRWSEDFGFFTNWVSGAMFGLGAGVDHPVLHGPDFDFNDDLITPGIAMMMAICRLAAETGSDSKNPN